MLTNYSFLLCPYHGLVSLFCFGYKPLNAQKSTQRNKLKTVSDYQINLPTHLPQTLPGNQLLTLEH